MRAEKDQLNSMEWLHIKKIVKLLEKHFRFKDNEEGIVDAAFRDHFETQTQMITISK